jgi:hypothetical protein
VVLLPTVVVVELLAPTKGYGGKGEIGDKMGEVPNELEGGTGDVEMRNP